MMVNDLENKSLHFTPENIGDVLELIELICYTTNHFRYSSGRNTNTPCNFRQEYAIILYQPASNNPPYLRN
ncbi:hypothetical protein ACFL0M_01640, partial [Thermodesulfobacteriota bacterium]